jgi:metal-responsive CopG/Arc/MetJ family transcriptional regulator
MTETVELSIEVPSIIKRAIERAASERGLSVSGFIQEALRRYLEEAGNLKNRRPTPR